MSPAPWTVKLVRYDLTEEATKYFSHVIKEKNVTHHSRQQTTSKMQIYTRNSAPAFSSEWGPTGPDTTRITADTLHTIN